MMTLFDQLDRETAGTYSLVLSAVGIGHVVVPTSIGYHIDVPEAEAQRAADAIQRYRDENPVQPVSADASHPFHPPFTAIAMALILLTIHLAVVASSAQPAYFDAFGASAGRIMGGELYRCATALLLHADAAHLAGNMVGLVLFGGAVCGIAGSGIGWLLILGCGIAGNLINAWVYAGVHLSVGASTAVFGAVGILCAIRSLDALQRGRGWKRVVIVAGAGVALLAFMGTGPRSDLGAHLFGGLTGMVAGLIYANLATQAPARRWQLAAGISSGLVLLAAWIRGAIH